MTFFNDENKLQSDIDNLSRVLITLEKERDNLYNNWKDSSTTRRLVSITKTISDYEQNKDNLHDLLQQAKRDYIDNVRKSTYKK